MARPVTTPQDVDAELKHWWQGDCVLSAQHFFYLVNPSLPLFSESQVWAANNPGNELVEVDIPDGLMVLTQTCDIRRKCQERPFIELAPLVRLETPEAGVPEDEFDEVIGGRRPRYATIPALHASRLAADLDQTITVEKAVVANWDRAPGCGTDHDRRVLSRQLAHKRNRAALPDEFVGFMRTLERRFKEIKRKANQEGEAFRAIQEVRVQASPDWYADQVELFFWFILKDEAPEADREEVKKSWLARLGTSDRYVSIEGSFTRYDLMKVSTYFDSDMLELDRLSPTE